MSLRRTVLLAAMGAVAMTVLLPCLALVRDTTGHDWYAAGKLTLTQTMMAAGFNWFSPTEYRAADGTIETVTRYSFTFEGEALWARARIVSTTVEHAVLGAIAGAIGAVLSVVVLVGARWSRRHRSGVPATAAVPGPSVDRGTWTRFGDIAGASRGDGSRIGLVVVSPAQIGGRVEVYGPVEIRGPLPVARIVQKGDENTARAVQRADAPAVQATRALPAARPPGAAGPGAAAPPESAKPDAPAAPGSTRKVEPRVGRTPRGQSRTPGTDPTIEGDGAVVREAGAPGRQKPGKGGGGHRF